MAEGPPQSVAKPLGSPAHPTPSGDYPLNVVVRTGAAGGRELVVVTVVHCHNRLGRMYLAVIAPFHRTILRANLERAVREMEG